VFELLFANLQCTKVWAKFSARTCAGCSEISGLCGITFGMRRGEWGLLLVLRNRCEDKLFGTPSWVSSSDLNWVD
jgi:hypothetical protein